MNPIYSSLAADAIWNGQIVVPAQSKYLHILTALETKPWAIQPEMLQIMLNRVHGPATDLEAVAAKQGRPLENTGGQISMRGRTAVLAIEGPIFRYANLLTSVSGATSVEMASLAFQEALDNPAVDRIVLAIDSPGGEVNGINSFADQIRAGSMRKPVIAYIDGTGASAAYWLASAASQIFADESSFVGSIGVVATYLDRKPAQERQGVKTYTIVSSQSPRKRADPSTEEGRAQIQDMVDATAELFISRVAQFRGVSQDQVMADFGAGGILQARKALDAGMIDGVVGFEPYLRTLENPPTVVRIPAAPAAESLEVLPMAEAVNPAGAVSPPSSPPNMTTSAPPLTTGGSNTATIANGIHYVGSVTGIVLPSPESRERDRIRGILTLPEAEGRQVLAQALALDDAQVSVDAAQRILAAAPPPITVAPTPRNEFERQMARMGNPKVGNDETMAAQDESPAAEAARVLRWIPKSAQYEPVN